ncbi:MAG: superoxide dismutase [Patescibacteria group bacterium]|jgi:Fe-Mn family superoxide dismutase
MAFTLPPLPYDYNALEPSIDEETMHFHHDKHHQGYLNKFNDALKKYPEWQEKSLEEIMANLEKLPEEVKTTVRNNGGGYYNHNLFWEVMKPDGSEPSKEMLAILESRFGGLKEFQDEFSAIAANHFASGWAWLAMKPNGTLTLYSTAGHDNPLMVGEKPLLVLDVWEHAYYLKYKNDRAEFIRNWWKVVNWGKVEENYNKAKETL